MQNLMIRILRDLTKQINELKNNNFEDSVREFIFNKISSSKFKNNVVSNDEVDKLKIRLTKDSQLRGIYDLDYDNIYLIKHPNNVNNYPDFCIIYHNTPISFEVKTSNNGRINWSASLPNKNCIYIYRRNTKLDHSIFIFEHSSRYNIDTDLMYLMKTSHEGQVKEAAKELYEPIKKYFLSNHLYPSYKIDWKSTSSRIFKSKRDENISFRKVSNMIRTLWK